MERCQPAYGVHNMTDDTLGVRDRFPILRNNPGIVYLDSASTTQMPEGVLQSIQRYGANHHANAGRGQYRWANEVKREIEQVRRNIAAFLHAEDPGSIVFTSGATQSLNLVAYAWGLENLKDGDEILFNPLDHASSVFPWINLKTLLKRMGIDLRLIPYRINDAGEADIHDILAKVSPRTRLITVSHIHNVFGSRTTLEELSGKIDSAILLAFDCSQSVGHIPVDVQQLRADFLWCSGHKMFAATGIGILYVNQRHHASLSPVLVGGTSGVITDLTTYTIQPATMPALLEAGTPNIVGIVSLGAALHFISSIGLDIIHTQDMSLTRYAITRIQTIRGLRFLPGVAGGSCVTGYGIVSFTIDGIACSDIDFILNARGIYVRTGGHCLAQQQEGGDSVRVSLHIYNSQQDIDTLCSTLESIAANV